MFKADTKRLTPLDWANSKKTIEIFGVTIEIIDITADEFSKRKFLLVLRFMPCVPRKNSLLENSQ